MNQAPPGAQQLALPDLRNVAHFGHVIVVEVTDAALSDVLIDVRTMSSRSGIGRLDTYSRMVCLVVSVAADPHTTREIDPDEPANMPFLLAFELTQAAPQRFCLNDFA